MPRSRRFRVSAALTLLTTSLFCSLLPARPAAAAVVYNGAGSAPRIGIIGDSAFAGIGVVGAFDPLKQFNFVYDAEACRRTILASCAITGRSAPANAMSVLRQRAGQWGSVLVMATGYNDPGHNFDDAVDAIMAEAGRQGIPKVMWITLRTAPMAFVPASYRSTSTTFRDNNLILLQKAAQYGGRLQIADWVGYTANRGEWFSSDGLHFRPAGAVGAAQFVAANARRVINGESITPTRDGAPPPSGSAWTHLRRGMGGTAVADLQRLLIAEGIFVNGGVTGVFNDGTLYAVATFQRRRGLHPNGIVDETAARALGMLSGSWNAFGRGAVGASVTRVQSALMARGIYVRGGATGTFDVWTLYAVQTFQRRQDIRVSGVVDAETARALGLIGAPHPSAFWVPLSRGSTGLNVARAQQALMNKRVYVRGGASGVFDVWTLYAVNTFQRYNGLTVSGVVDVETARALGLFHLSNPVATWTNLALGNAGPAVKKAEQLLAMRGVFVRDGADGVFKLGDFYAVQTFQRYNGLAITGVINLPTATRLGMFDPLPATTQVLMAASAPAPAPTTTTPTTTTTSTTTTTVPATTTTTASPVLMESDVAGHAWIDVDADGLHDTGEPWLDGVVVRALDGAGNELGRDVTDQHGEFRFAALPTASVLVEADIPTGLSVTAADQLMPGLGADESDDVDSDFVTVDVVAATARTDSFEPGSEGIDNIGLGLVPDPVDGSTTTTTTTLVETTTTLTATTSPDSTEPPTTSVPPTTVPPTTGPPTTGPPTTGPANTAPPTSGQPAPTTAPSSTVVAASTTDAADEPVPTTTG